MIFSEDFVENVREQNDILEVVSSYVSVAKKGHNYMGLCPFHPEKTPSFCVYHSTNSFYCFGCSAGGDVITFIMLAEKLQYREAVEFLANKAGISIPKYDENDNFLDRKTIFAMNRLSAKFFFSCLMDRENKLALNYLLSRGLLKKTIVHFGLGYSKSDGYSLVNFLKKNGFSDEKIEKANLGVKTKNNFLR